MDLTEEVTFSTTDGLVTFGAGVVLPTFDIYSDVSLVVLLLSIVIDERVLKPGYWGPGTEGNGTTFHIQGNTKRFFTNSYFC